MVKVAGVRFKNAGKIYYFDPGEFQIQQDTPVIVETARGIEYGQTVVGNQRVSESEIVAPLKKVLRLATPEDTAKVKQNQAKEKEAFNICVEKINKHELDMKLIDVEYTFDGNKILFYFTADGRVDFRELVKDLASIFRTRIELRQIGVRDEAKMLGGLGICGRKLCCASFLADFEPVSIKMAKEQSLSLNPTKISGICGRLMCCLKYEQDTYEELNRKTPKEGSIVSTPEGKGVIIGVSLLKGTLKIKLDKDDQNVLQIFNISDVKVLKDGGKNKEENLGTLKHLED